MEFSSLLFLTFQMFIRFLLRGSVEGAMNREGRRRRELEILIGRKEGRKITLRGDWTGKWDIAGLVRDMRTDDGWTG